MTPSTSGCTCCSETRHLFDHGDNLHEIDVLATESHGDQLDVGCRVRSASSALFANTVGFPARAPKMGWAVLLHRSGGHHRRFSNLIVP